MGSIGNMKKLKVMTIIGTRPELIKLCMVIAELDAYTDHVLVHTHQNFDYELNEIFFRELNIRKPNHIMEVAGETPAQSISRIISGADKVLELEKPDALLVLGDTDSCMSAIPAKKRQIPVFHMEAGNRCFDQRVPEETNRKIIDHISDINMPYTEHARRYLLAEGIKPETIIKTGSPMSQVLDFYQSQIDASDALKRLDIQKRRYFVVSIHRPGNVDHPAHLRGILDSLNAIAEQYDQPIIFSTHARTRKRLDSLGDSIKTHSHIRFLKPLGFFDYVHLQTNATCVISDSGTITEESSILNFPAITIRQAHERPEGMDEGTLIMTGLEPRNVLEALAVVIDQSKGDNRAFRMVRDYESTNVSKKVVRIILSYVDYVNHNMWHKHGPDVAR